MALIENIKEAPKMWSVQLASLITLLTTIQAVMEALGTAVIPAVYFYPITAFLTAGVVLVRVLKQSADSTVEQSEAAVKE